MTDEKSARPNDIIELTQGSPEWEGPDDVDNPHNWPVWKKVFHSAIPAIYSFGLYVQLFVSNV